MKTDTTDYNYVGDVGAGSTMATLQSNTRTGDY